MEEAERAGARVGELIGLLLAAVCRVRGERVFVV